MDHLEEKIEQLNKLFERLSIPENHLQIEEDEVPHQIVYDFSDEELENPFNPIKEEENPEPSRKRERDIEWIYAPDNLGEEILYKQGMGRYKGKWQKIPPKVHIESLSPDLLNLDCQQESGKVLIDWVARTSALIQLNDALKALSPQDMLNYIMHKTTGNVFTFLTSLSERERSHLIGSTGKQTFDILCDLIYSEFLGQQHNEESEAAFADTAFWRITNMKICNMCYLKEFICEFSEHYNNCRGEKRNLALEMFFNKFPEGVATEVKKEFQRCLNHKAIADTLEGRITVLKSWLAYKCNEETTKQQAQMLKL